MQHTEAARAAAHGAVVEVASLLDGRTPASDGEGRYVAARVTAVQELVAADFSALQADLAEITIDPPVLLADHPRYASAALAARAFAVPGSRRKGLATASAAAAWAMMEDAGIAEGVRFAAALDLAHGARIACDLVAFTHAKRAVLTLAPQATYPAVAAAVADLWPVGETPVRKMERAS